MNKFLFVTLLTISSASLCMENDTDNGTSMPYGNDIASTIDNEPAYSSCDSHDVDWGGPDLVSTSTQEMADYTFSQPSLDVCNDPSMDRD